MDFKAIARQIQENAEVIMNPSPEELREMARKDEVTTEFGSASYVTRIKNRSAKATEIIENGPNEEQINIINDVVKFLKGKKLICLQKTMGNNPKMSLQCRSYVTEDYARFLYQWIKTLFLGDMSKEPDMITIIVPEFPKLKILVDPKSYVTFVLGSDYFGECKKSNLRMAMHIMKMRGGLGLHAATKILKVVDKNGKLVEKGFVLFGLSGTGKTSLSLHDHDLNGREGIIIRQDDVVLMDKNGYCYGTEDGFYLKTEGLEPSQHVLYKAAISPNAVFENIYVDENGRADFMDYRLTTNGRGVILRREIAQTDDNVDLEKTDAMIFITRRDDVVPPVARLNQEQAAAAFMLGESIETSAGDPTKAGEAVRVVGTNPFIIGPLHEEGNRFLEILRKNPKIECYILNTGHVGGKVHGAKITVKDSATIIREIARGTIKWTRDSHWGYEIPISLPGIDPKKLDPSNYYSEEEYRILVKKLRDERKEWMAKFPELDAGVVMALTKEDVNNNQMRAEQIL